MNTRTISLIAAVLSLATTAPAPASTKPCRDSSGKIIACAKVRKPSPRCKDDKGRFVACSGNAKDAPGASPKP